MLQIEIPAVEQWDEFNEVFISTPKKTLTLEHSLVSISKWEAKWHKPFLTEKQKTREEIIDYIKCMTITQNVEPDTFYAISEKNLKEVQDYIADPMTATWFSNTKEAKGKSGKQITSELIYYWMVSLNIPFECQKWHLNRLLTLIKICNIENQPKKKQSKKDILQRNAALNAARKQRLGTSG